MKTVFSYLCILFILAMSSSLSFAASIEEVYFQSQDGTEIKAYMMRPEKPGKFPAIIALHGCGGATKRNGDLSSRHKDWAKRFVRWGYVVLFPESFESRGFKSLCKMRRRPVKQKHRVRDVMGAHRWLTKQSFIRANNISLIGWSNGGSTVLRVSYSKRGRQFRNTIAFYPGCYTLLKRANTLQLYTNLRILIGQSDDWTPPEPCSKLVRKVGGKIWVYENAYHGFDAPNSRIRVRRGVAYSKYGDGVVRFGTNKKARAKAIRYLRSIF